MAQSRSAKSAPQAGSRKSRLAMIVGGLCVVAACVAIRYSWNAESASAQSPAATARDEGAGRRTGTPPARVGPAGADRPPRRAARSEAAAAAPGARTASGAPAAAASSGTAKPTTELKIVAVVNGEPITREQLGQECLRHYGKEVLESMINKYLILAECKRLNITVSRAEVDAEIERMAQRFGLKVEAVAARCSSRSGASTACSTPATSSGPRWPCASWPANACR